MLNLFRMRKPRRFHHDYIYVDERKERMKEIERRARQELGLSSMEDKGKEKNHE